MKTILDKDLLPGFGGEDEDILSFPFKPRGRKTDRYSAEEEIEYVVTNIYKSNKEIITYNIVDDIIVITFKNNNKVLIGTGNVNTLSWLVREKK